MNDIAKPDRFHNQPPADLLLGDALTEKLRDENSALLSRRDDLIAAADRIPPVTDEDIARKVSDYIKQVTACAKAADTARVSAKEPYLEGGRGVDGFFKAISDPLAVVKRRTEASLTQYLRDKAEKERREREERERAAREEERKRREEAAAAEKAIRDEQTLAAALEADRRVEQARADAVEAEKDATAKPAEMSRVRGEYGALSSLRTTWTFSDLDRDNIDLAALRQHLPMDGLERAVRSFIKAGGRELDGVKIFQTTEAVVR